MRDRGYIDIKYFAELEEREAFLIGRASSSLNPIAADVIEGPKKWIGKKLKQLLKTKLAGVDLIVRWNRPGLRELRLRLVIRKSKKRHRPKKNRGRKRKWAKKNSEVVREPSCLQTTNRYIAEGLIWASLARPQASTCAFRSESLWGRDIDANRRCSGGVAHPPKARRLGTTSFGRPLLFLAPQ